MRLNEFPLCLLDMCFFLDFSMVLKIMDGSRLQNSDVWNLCGYMYLILLFNETSNAGIRCITFLDSVVHISNSWLHENR